MEEKEVVFFQRSPHFVSSDLNYRAGTSNQGLTETGGLPRTSLWAAAGDSGKVAGPVLATGQPFTPAAC